MRYNILKKVIIRTPWLGFKGAFSSEKFEKLIESEIFKKALLNSTKSLHDSKANRFDKKTRIKLYSFAQRMSFRPTPFGLFSGVMVSEIGNSNNYNIEKKSNALLGFKYKINHEQINIKQDQKNYRLNPTVYRKNDKIRFYEKFSHSKSSSYHLSECILSDEIELLLRFSEKNSIFSMIRLTSFFEDEGYDKEEIAIFLNELVTEKILIVIEKINLFDNCYWAQTEYDCNIGNNVLEQNFIDTVFSCDKSFNRDIHTKDFKEALNFLLENFVENSKNPIDDFTQKLILQFGYRKVDILEVFDPVYGIFYKNQSPLLKINNIVGDINVHTGDLLLNEKEIFLMNAILEASKTNQQELQLKGKWLKEAKTNKCFPKTMSVFSKLVVCNELEVNYIECITGPTALRLLNRFSYISEEINSICEDVSNLDKEYNDAETIVVEIAYSNDENSFNVNNRPNYYKYFIDCFSVDVNNLDLRIPLNDICLFVKDERLILYSKSLKKKLIPIHTTAYNQKLSDFPIYTFLSEYSSYLFNSSAYFSWGSLLDVFYEFPRVKFGDTVLSYRKWRIIKSQYIDAETFFQTKKLYQIPDVIIYIEGDQQIYVDLTNEMSFSMFLELITNKVSILLSEYLSSSQTNFVTDLDNKDSYEHEIISFVEFEKNNNLLPDVNFSEIEEKSIFYGPLNSWLYFNLYCNPLAANQLLKTISEILNSYADYIQKWFFIRYSNIEVGRHIRLRILGLNETIKLDIIKKIDDLLKSDILYHVEIDTYKVEVDRYSDVGYEIAEDIFCFDSQMQLKLIEIGKDFFWEVPVLIIESYFDIFKIKKEEQLEIVNDFLIQIKENIQDIKKYNKETSEIFRKIQNNFQNAKINSIISEFKSNCSLLEMDKTISKKQLSSLIHMSLNRYFVDANIAGEMLSMYLFKKYLMKILATSSRIN